MRIRAYALTCPNARSGTWAGLRPVARRGAGLRHTGLTRWLTKKSPPPGATTRDNRFSSERDHPPDEEALVGDLHGHRGRSDRDHGKISYKGPVTPGVVARCSRQAAVPASARLRHDGHQVHMPR